MPQGSPLLLAMVLVYPYTLHTWLIMGLCSMSDDDLWDKSICLEWSTVHQWHCWSSVSHPKEWLPYPCCQLDEWDWGWYVYNHCLTVYFFVPGCLFKPNNVQLTLLTVSDLILCRFFCQGLWVQKWTAPFWTLETSAPSWSMWLLLMCLWCSS